MLFNKFSLMLTGYFAIVSLSSTFGQTFNIGMSFNPIPPKAMDTANADGWVVLFDGSHASMQRNWWISNRSHGDGGRWWVAPDPELVQAGILKATDSIMWSHQNPGGEGGILQTHRRYKDLEARVWCKPGYGNDGGIFLRSGEKSQAWQIVIDYYDGGRLGEVYDEGTGHDASPDRIASYKLSSNGTKIDPEDRFEKDCGKTWSQLWSPKGFNEFYARVIGRPVTLSGGLNGCHWFSWTAKGIGNNLASDGMGYLGLQIHSGASRWSGGPNKYTRVEVRELDEKTGLPIYPVIMETPKSIKVAAGATATFTVVTKAAHVSYQWQKDGMDIVGATKAAYTIPAAKATDAGNYTVLVINTAKKAPTRSDAAVLEVGPSGVVRHNPRAAGSQLTWSYSKGNVEVSGYFLKPDIIRISNVSGRTIYRIRTGEGKFSKYVRLKGNGLFFISWSGKIPARMTRFAHVNF